MIQTVLWEGKRRREDSTLVWKGFVKKLGFELAEDTKSSIKVRWKERGQSIGGKYWACFGGIDAIE